MRIQRYAMQCSVKKCEREFISELVVDTPVSVFCASLKAVRCPQCGSKKVNLLFGKRYREAWQRLTGEVLAEEE